MFEKTREWVLEPSRKRTFRYIVYFVIVAILLVGLWLINVDEQQMRQKEEQPQIQTKKAPDLTTGTTHSDAQR